MGRISLHILLFILILVFLTQLSAGEIVQVKIEGTINEGSYLTLKKAFEFAEERNARAILIVIDTPGGLVSSTEKMISLMLSSKIPVITYVPPGSFSASAGSLIVIAGNIAGMANGTSIGAATPITFGVGEPKVEQKAVNYLASYAKAIAEKRGRNVSAVERFVREAYSASAKEAYRYGIIDVLADSIDDLLDKIDGKVVETSAGKVVLRTKGEKIVYAEKPFKAKVFDLISSPELASILLIIGIYALIFGLTSPGFGAEVLGAICLILALFGLGVIEVNSFGVLLIILGVLFLIAELLTSTYGILGVASIFCIVLGSIMLYEEPLMPKAFYESFPLLIGGIATGLGIIMTYIILKVIQVKRMKRKVGAEALIGKKGEVVYFSNGKGMAKIDGELWRIESQESLVSGDEVVVIGREGLVLKVMKK